jgi:hypothetical protein
MVSRILFLLTLFIAMGVNCTRDRSPVDPETSDYAQVNIITDFEKFDRASVELDPFHIDSVHIQGDLLTLFVTYGGGCQKHEFDLYSTDGIYLSLPPQGDVFLGHNGHGDTCEALFHEKLVFDLTPLLKSNPGGMGLRLFQYQEEEPFDTVWWRTK